jgi:hypothetical protein
MTSSMGSDSPENYFSTLPFRLFQTNFLLFIKTKPTKSEKIISPLLQADDNR